MTKAKRTSPTLQKAWKAEKYQPPDLNEKRTRTNYLLHVQMMIVKIKQENQLKITWIFLLILV